MTDRERTDQPATEDLEQTEVPQPQDVDMDPEDHVNRPDQPDFDPAERRPFEDPDASPLGER